MNKQTGFGFEYPKTIQIGAHTYTVTLTDSYSPGEDWTAAGDHWYSKSQIRVAMKTHNGEIKARTVLNVYLLHEIIEAINSSYSLNLRHNQIEAMSEGIAQALQSMGIELIKETIDKKE